MGKKKFSSTKVGQFIIGATSIISPALGNLISGASGISETLSMIRKSDISPEDKTKLESELIQRDIVAQQEVTKRWLSDNDAGMLTRYIRPSTLIYLTLAITLFIIADSTDYFDFTIKERWVSLVENITMVVYGGYFLGKSVEKTFKN